MNDALVLAVVAMATASTSFTIARTKVFQSFRLAILRRGQTSKFMAWLGGLVTCPYCLSHWFAAAGTLVFFPRLTGGPVVFDFLASWMATVTISACFIGLVTLGTTAGTQIGAPAAQRVPTMKDKQQVP